MASFLPEAQRRSILHDRGVGEIEPAEGVAVLGHLIAEGRPQVAVMLVSWVQYMKSVAAGWNPPYLARVAPKGEFAALAPEASGILGRLRQAPDQGPEILAGYVQERVAKILGYNDPAQVDCELTLLELGFDSLMSVQLRNAIRTSLEVDIPIGKLFDSTSIEQLTHLLHERITAAAAPPPARSGEHVEVI
jgi:acyl carrier protein